MTNHAIRFFGGPPLAVVVRLILLSILVGVVLHASGLDPWNILDSIRRFVLSIWNMGFDAVLMYAQRGHGKRASFYSDYTFGVWRAGPEGDELVPVGKAYFGFTDEELLEIDRFVRRHTVNRFGPVREVVHERDQGLVFEVAFERLQRSTRHKSGVAMRFPRINRLRWDKPPGEADRLETLEKYLEAAPG